MTKLKEVYLYKILCLYDYCIDLEQAKLPVEKKKKKPLAERLKEKEEAKKQKKLELEEVCFSVMHLISTYISVYVYFHFPPSNMDRMVS